MFSTYTPRPHTSVKWPSVTLLMSSLKLYARYGSTRFPGCAAGVAVISGMSGSYLVGTGRLADLEDDELGRLHGRDPDHGHDLAGVAHLGRVGLLVALDEERLLRRAPLQGPVAPNPGEEGRNIAPDGLPQQVVIGLEHDP